MRVTPRDADLSEAARPVLDHLVLSVRLAGGPEDRAASILASTAFVRIFLLAGGGDKETAPAPSAGTLPDDVALVEAYFAEDTHEHSAALAGFREIARIAEGRT